MAVLRFRRVAGCGGSYVPPAAPAECAEGPDLRRGTVAPRQTHSGHILPPDLRAPGRPSARGEPVGAPAELGGPCPQGHRQGAGQRPGPCGRSGPAVSARRDPGSGLCKPLACGVQRVAQQAGRRARNRSAARRAGSGRGTTISSTWPENLAMSSSSCLRIIRESPSIAAPRRGARSGGVRRGRACDPWTGRT